VATPLFNQMKNKLKTILEELRSRADYAYGRHNEAVKNQELSEYLEKIRKGEYAWHLPLGAYIEMYRQMSEYNAFKAAASIVERYLPDEEEGETSSSVVGLNDRLKAFLQLLHQKKDKRYCDFLEKQRSPECCSFLERLHKHGFTNEELWAYTRSIEQRTEHQVLALVISELSQVMASEIAEQEPLNKADEEPRYSSPLPDQTESDKLKAALEELQGRVDRARVEMIEAERDPNRRGWAIKVGEGRFDWKTMNAHTKAVAKLNTYRTYKEAASIVKTFLSNKLAKEPCPSAVTLPLGTRSSTSEIAEEKSLGEQGEKLRTLCSKVKKRLKALTKQHRRAMREPSYPGWIKKMSKGEVNTLLGSYRTLHKILLTTKECLSGEKDESKEITSPGGKGYQESPSLRAAMLSLVQSHCKHLHGRDAEIAALVAVDFLKAEGHNIGMNIIAGEKVQVELRWSSSGGAELADLIAFMNLGERR
jgi:hypothetical protein